jgi:signal transduction histidine kinase/DNA-binding response OmpR family regulator
MQVLYIEDSSIDRMAFERVVRKSDLPIHYTCAETLSEGLSQIRLGRFDVIIADLRLPDGSALDLLNQISDSGLCVIILTGVSDVQTAVQAIKNGASDYIVKDASREYLTTLPGHLETIIRSRIDTTRERLIGSMCQYSDDSSPVGVYVRDYITGEPLFFNSCFASRFCLPPYDEFVRTSTDHEGFWDTLFIQHGIPVDQINRARHKPGEIIRHDLLLLDGIISPLYSTIVGSDNNTSIRQFIFFFDGTSDRTPVHGSETSVSDSLSVLAGGIAHEMNNIFTSLLCDLSLAKELTPHISDLHKSCFDRADQAIQHGRDVASRILTYADGGYPSITTVSLQDLMAEALSLHHQGDAQVSIEIPDDLDLLKVDADLMRTALRAIVINAVEASPDFPVNIIAANVERCQDACKNLQVSFVRIEVRDVGAGIDTPLKAKVFEPFFTTKEGHLGLGLTSARSIIERHGGSISLSSSPGSGTIVRVLLPSLPLLSSTSDMVNVSKKDGSAGVRILVMDDEAGIREVLHLILKREGFHVDVVSRGEDAVAAVAQAYEDLNPYQVVILDLLVPGGMGGKEAILEIRKISPSILAIVSSGYSDDPISSHYQEYGFNAALPKPYHPQDMIRLLFSMLDEHYSSKSSR